jgi:hypothetical protein
MALLAFWVKVALEVIFFVRHFKQFMLRSLMILRPNKILNVMLHSPVRWSVDHSELCVARIMKWYFLHVTNIMRTIFWSNATSVDHLRFSTDINYSVPHLLTMCVHIILALLLSAKLPTKPSSQLYSNRYLLKVNLNCTDFISNFIRCGVCI